MTARFCFADEAGNFDFRPTATGASRYFILTTVALNDCAIGGAMMDLRRELALEGVDVGQPFHATEDRQIVRDRVFDVIRGYDLRVDSTIFDKAKALPRLQKKENAPDFYKLVWFMHLKHIGPLIWGANDDVLVVAAHLGTNRMRTTFAEAVTDVVGQTVRAHSCRAVSWPSMSDPCLWVADYCSWAIQRKWERDDTRSYDLICHRVASEYDIWRRGTTRYY